MAMHTTRIVTKDGKVYEGVVLDENITLLEREGKPYIRLVSDKTHEISLFVIESAVTENLRIGVGRIEDVDELPFWMNFYNENKSLRRV